MTHQHINHFPQKLKALRILHRMHQADLSRQTGIRRNLLVDIERGRAPPRPGPAQAAIEEAFGIQFNVAIEIAFTTLAPHLRSENHPQEDTNARPKPELAA